MAALSVLQEKWDRVYRKVPPDLRPEPAHVLKAYDYLLPAQGLAIDLACGLGGNAVFLAKRGLKTVAWDLSPVAVSRLNRIARQDKLDLSCAVRDLENDRLPHDRFDVMVMIRYLDRKFNKELQVALCPGGLLYFQTFVRDKDPAIGPENPDYLLGENELATLFSGLVLRAYCETGRIGDVSRGFRNEAFLVGQKPFSTDYQSNSNRVEFNVSDQKSKSG